MLISQWWACQLQQGHMEAKINIFFHYYKFFSFQPSLLIFRFIIYFAVFVFITINEFIIYVGLQDFQQQCQFGLANKFDKDLIWKLVELRQIWFELWMVNFIAWVAEINLIARCNLVRLTSNGLTCSTGLYDMRSTIGTWRNFPATNLIRGIRKGCSIKAI